jgi:hypothetical protein
MGPSGWRLLRDLLVADPKRRLTMTDLQASSPLLARAITPLAASEALAVDGVEDELSLLLNSDETECPVVDFSDRPSTIHVTLSKVGIFATKPMSISITFSSASPWALS